MEIYLQYKEDGTVKGYSKEKMEKCGSLLQVKRTLTEEELVKVKQNMLRRINGEELVFEETVTQKRDRILRKLRETKDVVDTMATGKAKTVLTNILKILKETNHG